MQTVSLPINRIYSLGNPRTTGTKEYEAGIVELAQSLAEVGQIIEIRVYPDSNDGYILTKGHRRLDAAKRLGWSEIRVVVEDAPADESDLLIGQYIENEQRKNMSFLDKARTYARLKTLGCSQRQIARKCNVSDADVSLALSTLRLTPKLQRAINDGIISPSAVEALVSQPLEVQKELEDAAIQAKTVRKVADLVLAYKKKQEVYAMANDHVPDDDIPEDADPLEEMAVEGLEEVLAHMEMVEQTKIRHPELRRQARPKVEQILRQAAALKKNLDGDTWPDTEDLV